MACSVLVVVPATHEHAQNTGNRSAWQQWEGTDGRQKAEERTGARPEVLAEQRQPLPLAQLAQTPHAAQSHLQSMDMHDSARPGFVAACGRGAGRPTSEESGCSSWRRSYAPRASSQRCSFSYHDSLSSSESCCLANSRMPARAQKQAELSRDDRQACDEQCGRPQRRRATKQRAAEGVKVPMAASGCCS
jgi:hypothetical protein